MRDCVGVRRRSAGLRKGSSKRLHWGTACGCAGALCWAGQRQGVGLRRGAACGCVGTKCGIVQGSYVALCRQGCARGTEGGCTRVQRGAV